MDDEIAGHAQNALMYSLRNLHGSDKPWLHRLLHADKFDLSAKVTQDHRVEHPNSTSKKTLVLSWAQDLALQQVLTDESGKLSVGETPDFSHDQPVFAPRIHKALHSHHGILVVVCEDDLLGVDWLRHIRAINPALKEADIRIRPTTESAYFVQRELMDGTIKPAPAQELAQDLRTNRHVFSLSYDLVDSTVLMTELGAEAYSVLLSRLHEKFSSIASRWQGKVDSPQGDDGCMCYFGLVVADEHAGLSCLQAALEMRDSARQNAWQVRIGIASGWLAVDSHHPVGLSVHLAARLQKMASTGAVLVTQKLSEHFSSVFEFEILPHLPRIKGFDEDVRAALLKNYNPLLKQIPHGSGSQRTPVFAGRSGDLLLMRQAWERTLNGHGTDLQITGVPGIGKSELVRHWLRSTQPKAQAHVLTCRPHDYRQPFAALSLWMAQLIDYSPASQPADSKKRLLACIASQPGFWPYRSEIADLLDIHDNQMNINYEDAQARHQRVLSALISWVSDQAKIQAQLFVVEDYQWIDASSALWIKQLRALIANDLPIMLIVNQRPQMAGQSRYEDASLNIELKPLDHQHSLEIITGMLPELEADQALLQQIQDSARGIPLYLRESARLLQSAEYRQKIRQARQLGAGLPVPQTLHDLIMERLDQIGDARLIAQIGSVLGESFSFETLRDVVYQFHPHYAAHEQLQTMLDTLERENIWIPSLSKPHVIYEFTHAIVRDVAYQSMWEADRVKLHRIAAQVLKQQIEVDLGNHHAQLAKHLAASGDIRSAIEHLFITGKRSKKRGAHEVATQTMQTILELTEMDDPGQASSQFKIEAHLALAGQLLITKGYSSDTVLNHYSAALQQAVRLQDHKLILRAQLGIQSFEFMRGNFERAHQLVSMAQQTALVTRHALSDLQCNWALANLYFYEGRLFECNELLEQCIAACKRHDWGKDLIQNPHVMATMYRAFILCCLGRYDESLELACRGREMADSGVHKLARLQAHGIAAMIYAYCGQWQTCLEASEKAIASCQPGEYGLWYAHANVMRSVAAAQLGDYLQGMADMKRHHNLWADCGGNLTRSYYWALEAQLLISHLDIEGAQHALESAVLHLNTIPERYYISEIERLQFIATIKRFTDPSLAMSAIGMLMSSCQSLQERGMHGFALRTAIAAFEASQIHMGTAYFTEAQKNLDDCLSRVQRNTSVFDVNKAIRLLAGHQSEKISYIDNYKKISSL